MASALAGGDLAKPIGALPNLGLGIITMRVQLFANAAARAVLQADIGGLDSAERSVQFSSDLQTATIYGTPATTFDTFSIANLALAVGSLFELEFLFGRNDGAGGTLVSITNNGNSQTATSARVNWNAGIVHIGGAPSYTSNPLFGAITAFNVAYPNDSRNYLIQEGQGASYPQSQGDRILWRNSTWTSPSARRKVMGQGPVSLQQRQTIFADRL